MSGLVEGHFEWTLGSSSLAVEFFRKTYVESKTVFFRNLVSVLEPVPGLRKLVIVDGHPRTGKSWAILGALTKLIGDQSTESPNWWTAGPDSARVFPKSEITLSNGIERLLSELRGIPSERHDSLKFVLLDDFFGGNDFRSLDEETDIEKLDSCLKWESGGDLFDSVPDGSVTIITGRSFCFLIIEALLGKAIRLSADNKQNVHTNRWGIFSSTSRQAVDGVFDSGTLQSIAKNNNTNHPYAHHKDDHDWLIAAAPLIAFDPVSKMDERDKDIASISLFADDLGNLAKQMRRFERTTFKIGGKRSPREIISELEYAYLAAVAPAFAFVGPDARAFEMLGVNRATASRLRSSMYYSIVSGNEVNRDWHTAAVVPNEFYMRALRKHFAKESNLAFASNLACKDIKKVPPALHALILRGIVERALSIPATREWDVTPAIQKVQKRLDAIKAVPAFEIMLQNYIVNDTLLQLELAAVAETGEVTKALETNANTSLGFIAATGWMMSKFFAGKDYQDFHSEIHRWTEEYLRREIKELASGNDVPQLTNLDGHLGIVATLFSTLLQWALTYPDSSERTKRVDNWIDFVEKECEGSLSALLKAILLDELIWAVLEHAKDCGARATDFLERFISKLNSPARAIKEEAFVTSSMVFSLSWHNAWRAGEEAVFSPTLNNVPTEETLPREIWGSLTRLAQSVVENPAVAELRNETNLQPIITNLQYHWLLFITQRAHWMRDWCFQDNPITFEATRFSQVAAGSSEHDHNDHFLDIAEKIIHHKEVGAIRNVLLMAGTRRHYLEPGRLMKILHSLEHFREDEAINITIRQAVFELQRQGFLDEPPVVETDFADPEEPDAATTQRKLYEIERHEKSFLGWCSKWLAGDDQNKVAWDAYRAEIKSVSYISDLQPLEDGYLAVVEFISGKLAPPAETLQPV